MGADSTIQRTPLWPRARVSEGVESRPVTMKQKLTSMDVKQELKSMNIKAEPGALSPARARECLPGTTPLQQSLRSRFRPSQQRGSPVEPCQGAAYASRSASPLREQRGWVCMRQSRVAFLSPRFADRVISCRARGRGKLLPRGSRLSPRRDAAP